VDHDNGASRVVGLVTSFITKREPSKRLDQFYRLLRTPVRPDEQIERPCILPPDAETIEAFRVPAWAWAGIAATWLAAAAIIPLAMWIPR
jgi:hypothetical protein